MNGRLPPAAGGRGRVGGRGRISHAAAPEADPSRSRRRRFGRRGEALSLTETEFRYSDGERLVEEYLGWRGAPGHPPSVVPLLTWGCAIWSLVDFSTPEGRMWGWDPNARCPEHGEALFPEDLTLAERLQGWLDGTAAFPKAPAGPYCTER
ncbi:hypothetical protein ACRAWF_05840 [Streptomyces sp. L7]